MKGAHDTSFQLANMSNFAMLVCATATIKTNSTPSLDRPTLFPPTTAAALETMMAYNASLAHAGVDFAGYAHSATAHLASFQAHEI